MLYGYAGNILQVDLSVGKVAKEPLDAEVARKFIGGMGLATKILYEEVGANVDPFSPDNIIIMATGPLTGTQAPTSGRIDLTTKSTAGIFGTANAGGYWAPKLKWAGYDAVVVRGRSEKPVYIWIDNDLVEIRDAEHLWGKDVWATTSAVKKELKESRPHEISVIAIGPAGENLVSFASYIVDKYHSGSRCGIGAVMGSKNLKAVAVRGKKAVSIAQPEKFREAVIEANNRIFSYATSPPSDRPRELPNKYGTWDGSQVSYERGGLPGNHYQTGDPPNWMETRSLEPLRRGGYIVKAPILEHGCYRCPIQCHHMVEIKTGKYAGLRISSGTWVDHLITWGAKLGIESYPAIMKCKETAHLLGMDGSSAAEIIGFAMELYQRRIIGQENTNGLKLEWGNESAVIKLLHKIGYREGFGAILADGVEKAAESIGLGSEKYVYTIKGLEMADCDPRSMCIAWSLGDLTNPRGGDNVKTTHMGIAIAGCRYSKMASPGKGEVKYDVSKEEWDRRYVEDLDMFKDVKKKVYGVPPKVNAWAYDGKAMLVKWLEELSTITNALGVCIFTSGVYGVGPTYLAKLFSSCTGWETTQLELMTTGERIFNLMRAYDVRKGITRIDDDFPAYFYKEPIPDGPGKGAVLSREEINAFLDKYYELRGWNRKSGIPTKEKLVELGLEEVTEEILKIKKKNS